MRTNIKHGHWILALIIILISTATLFGIKTLTTKALDCPCYVWADSDTPAQTNINDAQSVELGFKFKPSVNGEILGIRFYKGSQDTGTHIGSLWSQDGIRLAEATFINETDNGWQNVNFSTPISVEANKTYIASYNSPTGHYSATQNYFVNDIVNGPITVPSSANSNGNGVYSYGPAGTFPSSSYNNNNYWVDILFSDGAEPDNTGPNVIKTTPNNSDSNVNFVIKPEITFNEQLDSSSVNNNTVILKDSNNQNIEKSVEYVANTKSILIKPTAELSANTNYNIAIFGNNSSNSIKDIYGNPLSEDYNLNFSTGASFCGSLNEIACENTLTGTPKSVWDIGETAGDPAIQGFSTDISVNRGNKIDFKIKSESNDYFIDIYRLGYYNGDGARKITSLTPLVSLPQAQPDCLRDEPTGLVDCGNWAVSASWDVPSTAVSGVYIGHLKRKDTSGSSHIMFVVRNDSSQSDLLYQTSDTTWGAAYNDYGGNSLYTGSPAGRSYKVSLNRPNNTRDTNYKRTHFFANEEPMIRWLESNGYDTSYTTGVDTDRQPVSVLQQHNVFISSGHDEYWSGTQRAKVEQARDSGVNLAFFSGNEVFWKTRWENSIDGSGQSHRTLVSYKETKDSAKIDPSSEWTGTWRDPRFSPPSDGGKPENSLTGQIFTVNCCTALAMNVPEGLGKLRFWRNTSVANLGPGQTATLTPGTIGFEFDEELDNSFRPNGLIRMSETNANGINKLQDYGNTYATGSATHSISLYKAQSGALVFGAGTVRWSWGLDGTHDDSASAPNSKADIVMQQATVNLLADMDAQPTTLKLGLVNAQKTTDITAPNIVITNPANNSNVTSGDVIEFTGTALDQDGRVASVEVSVDNGLTWRRANGTENWSFNIRLNIVGNNSIKVRSIDDSLNISPPISVDVNVTSSGLQSIFSLDSTPANFVPESDPVELGMKFRSDVNGLVRGVTFYKGANNTGTHIGNLWDSAGNKLASVTFSNESASGWQRADFDTPVSITANTTYVVSYFAPNGNYSATGAYFANSGADNLPLRGLASGVDGSNGVYTYGSSSAFPTSSYNNTNYWVDVVFSEKSQSLFLESDTPTITSYQEDSQAVELGMKFQPTIDGRVSGIRFYKGANNTGTHIGNLWDSAGNKLASVTFSNESASGWQRADFDTPVSITANTTYVVSYFAPNGNYAVSTSYFTNDKITENLIGLSSNTSGGNGLYSYNQSSTLPTNSFNSNNYWIDIVFYPNN